MPIVKIWILPVSNGAPVASAESLSVPPTSPVSPPDSENVVSAGGTSVPPATTPSATCALVSRSTSALSLMFPRSPHATFALARLTVLDALIGTGRSSQCMQDTAES
jgi:hypothetical protein